MEAVNDGLKAFADPSFQLLLVDAQKTAAATIYYQNCWFIE